MRLYCTFDLVHVDLVLVIPGKLWGLSIIEWLL